MDLINILKNISLDKGKLKYYKSKKSHVVMINFFVDTPELASLKARGKLIFDDVQNGGDFSIETKPSFEWKWIGGTDDEIREFEKLTKVKAQEVGLKMMGILSATEMIRELLSSDIYVHTSYSDNSPNAVCEAQYLGMPVIATDTGGVISLFSEQYDKNMMVPMNDPFYLASKIIELREDDAKAKCLAEDHWVLAHRRHDAERISKQLKDTYLQLCGL